MDVVGFLHGSDKRKRKRRHEGYRFCVGKCVHGLDCRSKLASTRRPQFGCRRCPRPRLESKSKSKSKEQTKRTDRSTQTTAVRAHYSVGTPSPKAEWAHAVRVVNRPIRHAHANQPKPSEFNQRPPTSGEHGAGRRQGCDRGGVRGARGKAGGAAGGPRRARAVRKR